MFLNKHSLTTAFSANVNHLVHAGISFYGQFQYYPVNSAMDPIIDMEVDNRLSAATDIPGRWESIQYLLTRGSPLAHPEFEPSEEVCYAMRC